MFSNLTLKAAQVDDGGALQATAELTVAGIIRLRNVRVVKSRTGLFVAMPSQKIGEDRIENFEMLSSQDQKALSDFVLKEYARKFSKIP